ncbi:MAG TPA: lytic murein transglycosylase [Rhodobacteraceae bacterium]|jgi:lytic murein transglycosylase|nr:lytic murein transglycosylase [Paracoccaceae bacterium]
MRLSSLFAALLALTPTSLFAAQCGGDFNAFLNGIKAEAIASGHSRQSVNQFLKTAAIDPAVLRADKAQGVFKMAFSDFAGRVIRKDRMVNGEKNAKKYAAVFKRAQQTYGVDPSVILAFWALETDYGAVQGDFNTLNALLTLSHDCRRPELFRPQIFAALELYKQGDFDPARTLGAWAGEIGMVQMLPDDILHRGVDGDGDGHVTLKTSAPDAIMTAANMLQSLGWRANEPWLVEVSVPKNLDWTQTGLETEKSVADWARLGVKAKHGDLPANQLNASILLPEGRFGPVFMVLPNYRVYFEWNQSFVYVTTAAYFATRLDGAPVFDKGNPEPSLSDADMRSLQTKFAARGHDVGKIDGILGSGTRGAVRAEQTRLGLPTDGWPNRALLNAL